MGPLGWWGMDGGNSEPGDIPLGEVSEPSVEG